MIYDPGKKLDTPISDSVAKPTTDVGKACYTALRQIEGHPLRDRGVVRQLASRLSTVERMASRPNGNGHLMGEVRAYYDAVAGLIGKRHVDPLLAQHAGIMIPAHIRTPSPTPDYSHTFNRLGAEQPPSTPLYDTLLGEAMVYASIHMRSLDISFTSPRDLGLTELADTLDRVKAAEESGEEPDEMDLGYITGGDFEKEVTRRVAELTKPLREGGLRPAVSVPAETLADLTRTG